MLPVSLLEPPCGQPPSQCVPLFGSEPDAKVDTLSTARTLYVCLGTHQGTTIATADLSCVR